MSGEPSELPQFYGGKTSDGEVVKRPRESDGGALVASPTRAYYPGERGISPERGGMTDSEAEPGRIGLRRRTSAPIAVPRVPGGGGGDYDTRARRQRMIRDEAYWDERDYDRGYRRRGDDLDYNFDAYDRKRYRTPEPYTSKPYIEETRGDYYPDEPRTPRRRRRDYDEESIDGYNYSGPRGKNVDFRSMTREERAEVLRLPWSEWMNSDFKNHFVATVGEFVGTTMFLFFGFAGAEVANIGTASLPQPAPFDVTRTMYIALIFGFSLMVNVWIFFRISGGLFNPAVTLGMVLVGAIPIVRAICLFFAQLAGGIAASAMVLGLFPETLSVNTKLGGGTTLVQGVFIEALLTAELVFTIFMLAKEKHKSTFLAPVGIGLALFIAHLVGIFYTGASLNPARSFGPAVVTTTFVSEHWIYWVGPLIGALIAVFFYKFIKILEYEMANPGQDGDPLNDPTVNDEKLADVMSKRLSRTRTGGTSRSGGRRSAEA